MPAECPVRCHEAVGTSNGGGHCSPLALTRWEVRFLWRSEEEVWTARCSRNTLTGCPPLAASCAHARDTRPDTPGQGKRTRGDRQGRYRACGNECRSPRQRSACFASGVPPADSGPSVQDQHQDGAAGLWLLSGTRQKWEAWMTWGSPFVVE